MAMAVRTEEPGTQAGRWYFGYLYFREFSLVICLSILLRRPVRKLLRYLEHCVDVCTVWEGVLSGAEIRQSPENWVDAVNP